MIDDEIKLGAIICIVIVGFIVISPLIEARVLIDPYSELGILGPNGVVGGYPNKVVQMEPFNLTLYVGNHEGRAQYYRILAKVGDKAQNVTENLPYNATVIASWDILLPTDRNTTLPIQMIIKQPGLNRRLVFELYRYDPTIDSFVYHHRWNQVWMNVTSPN